MHLFFTAYKWTLRDVDEMTWPQLMSLKDQIVAKPPNDVVVGWQTDAERAEAEQPQNLGVPVKKGKVKRRKDGD
jgi:hypothetical protein